MLIEFDSPVSPRLHRDSSSPPSPPLRLSSPLGRLPPAPSRSPTQPPPLFPPSPSPTRRPYLPPSKRASISESTLPNTTCKSKLKDAPKPCVSLLSTLYVVVPDVNTSKVAPAAMKMMMSVRNGLHKGKQPLPTPDGTGGNYFMLNEIGNKIAIFKPINEEVNAPYNPRGLIGVTTLKKGITAGEGAMREIAAFTVDHPRSGRRVENDIEIGFSGVPLTTMAACISGVFNNPEGFRGGKESRKCGSIQKFIDNCESCEDYGSGSFPTEEVHKIAVLDLRIGNADRHAGNILIKGYGTPNPVLIPIDHGCTFPESFEDLTFEWLYWRQAKEAFSKDSLDYIKSLDVEEDLALLKTYGMHLVDMSIRTMRISTSLLKDGAAIGLSPHDIGRIVCREVFNKESVIEKILVEAEKATPPVGEDETEFLKSVSDLLRAELIICLLNRHLFEAIGVRI